MARITLRQLLDHAAEHGYGVPAFNINNMEQGLAIMEAAAAVDAPVILQACRGARSYAGDIMLAKMIEALERDVSADPALPAPGPRQRRGDLPHRDPARLHLRDDGRLAEGRRQDAGDYDYNVDITRRVADMAHWVGASVEGELGVLGSLETRRRRAGGRPRRRGQAQPRPAADRPRPGGRFRRAPPGRRAGDRHGHLPRRLQVHRASRTATSWRCTWSRRSTAGCRTRIWSCTAPPRCRRRCRTCSTSSAARCRRPGACRSRRSSAASATACARSTSTPTAAWR